MTFSSDERQSNSFPKGWISLPSFLLVHVVCCSLQFCLCDNDSNNRWQPGWQWGACPLCPHILRVLINITIPCQLVWMFCKIYAQIRENIWLTIKLLPLLLTNDDWPIRRVPEIQKPWVNWRISDIPSGFYFPPLLSSPNLQFYLYWMYFQRILISANIGFYPHVMLGHFPMRLSLVKRKRNHSSRIYTVNGREA